MDGDDESGGTGGLRGLFRAWAEGAEILAGGCLHPADRERWEDGGKVDRRCPESGCGTTVFGWTDEEADERLRAHRVTHHG